MLHSADASDDNLDGFVGREEVEIAIQVSEQQWLPLSCTANRASDLTEPKR